MYGILLNLKGPLQSYGSSDTFEYRGTDYHPSKSAIIGLIASSLGYRRTETSKIKELNNLKVIFTTLKRGNLLEDYQTAFKYKKDGSLERTYVTERVYLSDWNFLALICHERKEYIDKIYYAMKNPYFFQSLGRRSCIVNYDLVASEVIEVDVPSEFFVNYCNDVLSFDNDVLTVYADKDLIKNEDFLLIRGDLVKSFSQKNRSFGKRVEKVKVFNKNNY